MFSLWSRVVFLKSSTQSFATHPLLCHTTAQEALLLSLAFPWYQRDRHFPQACLLCLACDSRAELRARHLLKPLTLCWGAALTLGLRPWGLCLAASTECALAPEQVLRVSLGALVHVWVKGWLGCKGCRALGGCPLSAPPSCHGTAPSASSRGHRLALPASRHLGNAEHVATHVASFSARKALFSACEMR